METTTMNIPVLALRGLTAFPNLTLSLEAEREISIFALDSAMQSERKVFLVTQREIGTADPEEEDLYEVGTVCRILQIVKISDTSVRLIVEGIQRARLNRLWQTKPFLQANVELLEEGHAPAHSTRVEALLRQTYSLFGGYQELVSGIPADLMAAVLDERDPGHLADLIAQNITLRHQDRQRILEQLHPVRRLMEVNEILAHETDVLSLEVEMQQKVRERVGRVQRDMVLREQMKVLQHELGEDGDEEIEEYTHRVHALRVDDEIRKKLLREVDRLAKQPYGSAEASVIRNYLDVCLEVPWGKRTRDRADVAQARKILDRDHFGLQEVKERILEFIAVRQICPESKGKILCLVGPPGVGKTSIALSVAKAMNRRLYRLSLGGVRDEAEIRGHRRTYIGAIPGRIISGMKQAGTMNPVFLFDEIDKMSHDFRGDPASAMLEVLDGEQNGAFRDHYLELPFDLSRVMFITTANSIDTIPTPLLDRMEVIEVPSYTEEEKLQIAKRHLLPKQVKEHGLDAGTVKISDRVMRSLIEGYTREAGVRTLERTIAKVIRKAAVTMLDEGETDVTVTEKVLHQYLGAPRFTRELPEKEPRVGIVNGLAYTTVGGETLEVECLTMPGKGGLRLTGQLGDVMKESAEAAFSYVRAHCADLGLADDFYKDVDIHIHVPEGAVPKDGPSAGVTMATALVSVLTGIPVRNDVAMTGEITLRGRVLPIGGLKEKTLAAYRAGITTLIIPKENQKDLEEIPPHVLSQFKIVCVEQIEQVLENALTRMPEKRKS